MIRILGRNAAAWAGKRSTAAVVTATNNNQYHSNNNNQRGPLLTGVGVALAAGAAGALAYSMQDEILPKVEAAQKSKAASGTDYDEKELIEQENRLRQFGTMDNIYRFFSTYQFIQDRKKEALMSVKDFYNAVAPGSILTHGTGQGTYVIVTLDEITSGKTYETEKLPIQDSVLNKIQLCGLLTYIDFVFLLNILSTPRRYLDIAFHAFDVSADGNCEAKEFVHVMAAIAGYKGDTEKLVNDPKSGLMNYLFGKDRTKVLNPDRFKRFQRELIQDILYLEFMRYGPEKDKYHNISEVDFCTHLLYNSSIPSKKKAKLLKRVDKVFSGTKGVSFEEFKNFYYVLFGGADLERAMFFLDSEKKGVTRAEFIDIARWVANRDISEHIVDVVFTLLDEDGDEHLSIKEFQPVLFQWRHSRGFQKASLLVSLGHLKI